MLGVLIKKVGSRLGPSMVRRIMNLYPPFIGAGIRIHELKSDFRYMRVDLKFKWYNRNYVGTQFGGGMYMMTDPFYMFMLINILGHDYVVWDKAAQIEFIHPGRTALFVEFMWSEAEIQNVIKKTQHGDKYIFDKVVQLKDEASQVVAEVKKTLYVRRRRDLTLS